MFQEPADNTEGKQKHPRIITMSQIKVHVRTQRIIISHAVGTRPTVVAVLTRMVAPAVGVAGLWAMLVTVWACCVLA